LKNYVIFKKDNSFAAVDIDNPEYEIEASSWRNEGYEIVCNQFQATDKTNAVLKWNETKNTHEKSYYAVFFAIAAILGIVTLIFSMAPEPNVSSKLQDNTLTKTTICESLSGLHILQVNKKLGTSPSASSVKLVFKATVLSEEKYGLDTYYNLENQKYLQILYLTGIEAACSEINKETFGALVKKALTE